MIQLKLSWVSQPSKKPWASIIYQNYHLCTKKYLNYCIIPWTEHIITNSFKFSYQVARRSIPAIQAATRHLHVTPNNKAAEISSILEERILGAAPKVLDMNKSIKEQLFYCFDWFRKTWKRLAVSWALEMVSPVYMDLRTSRLRRWWNSPLVSRYIQRAYKEWTVIKQDL